MSSLTPKQRLLLDEQSGPRAGSNTSSLGTGCGRRESAAGYSGGVVTAVYDDSGGASRFFYCAKASRAERDLGLGRGPLRQSDDSRKEGDPGGDSPRNRGVKRVRNHHPTVKPLSLMRWLVRLVCAPGGVVLDTFIGSGTTAMAALAEDMRYLGAEMDDEYIIIARRRAAYVATAGVSELELADETPAGTSYIPSLWEGVDVEA